MFDGYITALVTPFQGNDIDADAFVRLLDRQINGGVGGVIIGGTTGEGLTLTPSEHQHLLTLAMEKAGGVIPVIAGILNVTTDGALALARQAESVGVSGLMVTAPPYIKPNQHDIYHYIQTIHDQTNTPLILYNNPGRSGVSMHQDTLTALAQLPRVVALKDAGGEVSHFLDRAPHLKPGFVQLCGDDVLAPAALGAGAGGIMSVTSNVAPRLCVDFYAAFKRGDYDSFAHFRGRLHGLHRVLFSDTSPGVVKYALWRMGLCAAQLRLPLLGPNKSIQANVDDALIQADLMLPLCKEVPCA